MATISALPSRRMASACSRVLMPPALPVGVHEGAGGDAEHIHPAGGLLQKGDALGYIRAAGDALVPHHPHFDGDLPPGDGMDGLQHLQGEAPAVLRAAAVGVAPPVPEGGEEGGDQVAVGEVGHDHVEARLHAPPCGGHIVLDDPEHLRPADLPVAPGGLVVFLHHAGDPGLLAVEGGPLARVDQLGGKVAVEAVDLVRQQAQAGYVHIIGGGKAAVEIPPLLKVHGGGADGHQAAARLGLGADEFQQLMAHPAVLHPGVVGDDGRELDAVAHRHAAHLDGPVDVGEVIQRHIVTSQSFSINVPHRQAACQCEERGAKDLIAIIPEWM